jgi:Fungal Zn(2)-Cys(6) binuclear cluster domain
MTFASTRDGLFLNQPLPTPTSTSASVISDEDVAIQLMRLTDPLATPILSPSVVDEENDTNSIQDEPSQSSSSTIEHSRCTHCISSKKGCDRKRPCSRCVQQGFEEWQCTSDDEKGTAKRKIAALRRSTMMGRTIGRSRRIARP